MTTWVKVYNSMPQNPKLLRAGERAAWLYVCGLCYANEHLTDGFIPGYALPVVAPGVKSLERLAATLVACELWHAVEGGWRVHDYEDHQRSADEIRGRRAADAARKAQERAKRSPADVRADSAQNPEGVQPLDVDVDVEGREEEKNTTASLRSAMLECFAYWQQRCGHPTAQLGGKRQRNIEGRLKDRRAHHGGDLSAAIADIRLAIDGAARAPYVDANGKRFDDVELICRNVEKLEDFMGRATSTAPLSNVVAFSGQRRENATEILRRVHADNPPTIEGQAS